MIYINATTPFLTMCMADTLLWLGRSKTREQQRALEILADAGQNGATEATMLAYGFWARCWPNLCLLASRRW